MYLPDLHDLYRYYPLLAAPSNVSGGLLSSPLHSISFPFQTTLAPARSLSLSIYPQHAIHSAVQGI